MRTKPLKSQRLKRSIRHHEKSYRIILSCNVDTFFSLLIIDNLQKTVNLCLQMVRAIARQQYAKLHVTQLTVNMPYKGFLHKMVAIRYDK